METKKPRALSMTSIQVKVGKMQSECGVRHLSEHLYHPGSAKAAAAALPCPPVTPAGWSFAE